MSFVYGNNVSTIIVADVTVTDTTIPLLDVAKLPEVSASNPTLLTLYHYGQDGREADWEIVQVNAVDTTAHTVTVVRGQEGTTAKDWAAGAFAEIRMTAGSIAEIQKLTKKASANAVAMSIVLGG
jgi:hypothetical protein